MKIAIDFDGTCVTHMFPEIGEDIGAVPVLQDLVRSGHQLILFTMRSGVHLDEAARWFAVNNISLHGIQYDPDQTKWTSSNKCYAQLYIDDAALGIPLVIPNDDPDARPYVRWSGVREMLEEKKILRKAA